MPPDALTSSNTICAPCRRPCPSSAPCGPDRQATCATTMSALAPAPIRLDLPAMPGARVATPADNDRLLLIELLDEALSAVDPLNVVPPHLPEPPRGGGRTIVLGAGKAAARMALAVEQ